MQNLHEGNMDPIIQIPSEVLLYQVYDYSPPSIVKQSAFFPHFPKKIMVLVIKQQIFFFQRVHNNKMVLLGFFSNIIVSVQKQVFINMLPCELNQENCPSFISALRKSENCIKDGV